MQNKLTFKQSIISVCIIFLFFGIWYEIPDSEVRIDNVLIKNTGIVIKQIVSDLIVQGITADGIWASRGYDIYLKGPKSESFVRISRVPVPLGTSYLGNIRLVRDILNKHEILEVLCLSGGNIIAFGGGFVFLSETHGKSFKKVAKLEHFGLGEGRGILPQGYTADNKENVYWGEYWSNKDREAVTLWKSEDRGNTWKPVHVFAAGSVRHIHAVQYDSYMNAIWVATGDYDSESAIMYSTDGGKTFVTIGTGDQVWRTVSLIFTKNYVYWGMDGTSKISPQHKILCWDRLSHKLEDQATLDSAAFYSAALDDGTLAISTDGLTDGSAIWLSSGDNAWKRCAIWHRRRDNGLGTIRMVANGKKLIISIVNLTPYDNDLIVVVPES